MRNRGSAILIEGSRVALIKRVKADCIYYVFPGGGIKEGETPEDATKREAYEELGVQINIKEYFGTVDYNGTQYYFLADIVSGVFGSGQGEEILNFEGDRGIYKPMWVEINTLSTINVRPKEMALKINNLFK
jgi:8-oxo-dGTP diphosphatase